MTAIGEAVHAYDGWSYGPLNAGAKTIDCCAFVASTIVATKGPRTDSWWRQANLWPEVAPSPWAPCYMAAEAYRLTGGHVQLPHDRQRTGDTGLGWQPWSPPLDRWLVCQGWRLLDGAVDGQGDRGHTFFWRSHPGHRWRGWIVESSRPHGPQVQGEDWILPLAAVEWARGVPVGPPMDWGDAISHYRAGLASVTLPEGS